MKVRITDELAQQIVDSAKAVVGWNVNFIDCQGRIMASTDSGRIGTYHKAGHVAARTGQVVMCNNIVYINRGLPPTEKSDTLGIRRS